MEEESIEAILCNEWEEFSQKIDHTLLQDSFSWRSARVARLLALALFNKEGKLEKNSLQQALFFLEKKRFSLVKDRHHDADFMNQVYHILSLLSKEGNLVKAFMRICKPYINPTADRVIRATLHLSENAPIGDREARVAACSALLCQLRQNVGSCFATAPAIRIQQEFPYQLLADLNSLFSSRALRRIIEGVEYAVPFSISFGLGELLKPVFLDRERSRRLFYSPSLLLPLEEAAIIEKEASQDEKEKRLQLLFEKSELFPEGEEFHFYITGEKIIRSLLRAHFQLSKEEAEEPSYVGVSPMRQIPLLRGKKIQQKERYEKALHKAKEHFIAMTDNPLLKAWEFTLASLSESKADFAGWNLNASLGLHPEEPHGIGQIIYEKIQEKAERLQREIEDMQARYEQIFLHVKHLEGRLQQSRSEGEISWLRAEYNVRKIDADHALILRDEAYAKREKLRHLFTFILRFYQEKCKSYFQEVYDPEMQDLKVSLYDDSPAGFRLLYKHGRENPSLWSYIHSLEEYSDMLSAFFTATEVELIHLDEVKGVERDLTEIVTSCVLGVKEEAFLEASFKRLAKAYGEPVREMPLQHLAQIQRKPWAYISGGTMTTLLHCYYGFSGKLEEKSRWVENESELFAFYLDSCRELPLRIQKYFLEHREASLLAFSPTHAFLFKPGFALFAEGWQSDRYSYTWIRDEIVNPAAKYIASLEFDREMMSYITKKVCERLPKEIRAFVGNKISQISMTTAPMYFREEAVERLSYERWLQGGDLLREITDQIDANLYESIPFSFGGELLGKIGELCRGLIDLKLFDQVMEEAKKREKRWGRYELISSQELLNLTKELIRGALGSSRMDFDLHAQLQKTMHKLGYALREPVLFADTNWTKQRFGFCVNPGTLSLELWRFDRTASSGRPMSLWKEHLNGQSKGSWGVLTNPKQYGDI